MTRDTSRRGAHIHRMHGWHAKPLPNPEFVFTSCGISADFFNFHHYSLHLSMLLHGCIWYLSRALTGALFSCQATCLLNSNGLSLARESLGSQLPRSDWRRWVSVCAAWTSAWKLFNLKFFCKRRLPLAACGWFNLAFVYFYFFLWALRWFVCWRM